MSRRISAFVAVCSFLAVAGCTSTETMDTPQGPGSEGTPTSSETPPASTAAESDQARDL